MVLKLPLVSLRDQEIRRQNSHLSKIEECYFLWCYFSEDETLFSLKTYFVSLPYICTYLLLLLLVLQLYLKALLC